jgi:hypothetical protein
MLSQPMLACFTSSSADLYAHFPCVGYTAFVKTQNHLHEHRKTLMLELDACMHQTTDMLTNEQHISMLDLLSSLESSLDESRQALTSLGSLMHRTCSLEQLAKLMVYSFPYWCQAGPRKCKGVHVHRRRAGAAGGLLVQLLH